jgi:subtilisin-like proprotein convertase family protein
MRMRGAAAALIFAAGLTVSAPQTAWSAGRGEPGPVLPMKIVLRDRLADLKLLHDLDIDIDGVFETWARVYVLPEEVEKLTGLGFDLSSLAPESGAPVEAPFTPETTFAVPSTYHTYETLTSELQQIAATYPSIVRLYSLGLSVQGRNLWMVKITKNPDVEEDEPEVRFIAAMHGDEVVGKEMCVNLINLIVAGYGTDPRLTALVDQTEIWILPSMNPDGTALVSRYNANNVDLNRNFPDQFNDPVDAPAGRAIETQHVMNWGYGHSVNLSANMHGGALVANYPYDGTASGASVYSLAPDDALWESLARTYADRNLPMKGSNSDASFMNGVCNGADWYHISGGMQDWNYVWRGGKELTLEISNSKWPAGSQLPQFWEDNREAMLTYLERAREGLHGIVRDAATGAPLAATIHIGGNVRDTLTDPDVGDYHRLLLPGAYTVEVTAPGYSKAHFDDVIVSASQIATRLDVDLTPLAANLQPAAYTVLDGGNGALDPGETSDLSLSLQTLGSAASGISAELLPVGWAATVVRSQATHQDVAVSGLGPSIAPHYRISLSPLAPPGSLAGFAVRWTANEGSGTSTPFFIPVGATTCTTTASTNVPKTIADRQTASSTLTVAGDRQIDDVNVFVNIAHPYIGDLHVRVISPDGVPLALHARTGGSADNIQGWYDTALTPSEPLTRLRGGHAAGTWKLEVEDGVPLNTGNILGWSVQVCGRPFEATLPPMKIRDVAKSAGGVDVTFWPYPSATAYRVYRSSDPRSPGSFTEVTDTTFHDDTAGDAYWLVSGVNASGEGPVSGP